MSDELLLKAVQIYLEVRGMSRKEFVEELKDLAEQSAPMRFYDLLSENEAA